MKPYESDSDDEDYNVDFDESKLPAIEIPPGDHKLQSCYNLWYARKGSHRASEYGKSLHFIGRCGTVEQWWSLYCHLLRPTELKPYRKLHLFKSGIKPMWEDPENIKGRLDQWRISDHLITINITRRQVDSPVEKEQSESSLGKCVHGDVGRAVSGRRGDLRYRPLHPISRRLTFRLEPDSNWRRQYKSNKGRAQKDPQSSG